MGDVTTKEHRDAAGSIRNLMAVHSKNEDLINIGAYVTGSDPLCDKAIGMMNNINKMVNNIIGGYFVYLDYCYNHLNYYNVISIEIISS
jgi:flagellar biosynthesis/type III secretory pathway ATPase